MVNSVYTVVLSIAGSDSGGGAGIQGDIKTISALGCYAATAITAITAQNTMGVTAIHAIPVEIVKAQVLAVIDDLKPAAIKIGMVYSADLASTLVSILKTYPDIPIIFDPVMVATSGSKLIQEDTIDVLKNELLPLTRMITPNLDEASILAEMDIRNVDDMKVAAKIINQYRGFAVLIKGGHLQGKDLYDIYLDQHGVIHQFHSELISTNNTHGTGCGLSSAIASQIALGESLIDSVYKAKSYIHKALLEGKDVKTGAGNGPLNHFYNPEKLYKKQNF